MGSSHLRYVIVETKPEAISFTSLLATVHQPQISSAELNRVKRTLCTFHFWSNSWVIFLLSGCFLHQTVTLFFSFELRTQIKKSNKKKKRFYPFIPEKQNVNHFELFRTITHLVTHNHDRANLTIWLHLVDKCGTACMHMEWVCCIILVGTKCFHKGRNIWKFLSLWGK